MNFQIRNNLAIFFKDKRLEKFLFVIILILTLCLSLWWNFQVITSYSLDTDEIISVNWVRDFSFTELIWGSGFDPGNPPLYYLLLKAWIGVFGVGDFQGRSISLIFGIVSTLFIILISERYLYFTNVQILVLTFLFASSSFIQFHFRYARAYGLGLTSCLSTYYFLNNLLFKKSHLKLNAFGLGISLVVGLYTHYSFIFFYLFLIISLFIAFPKKRLLANKYFIFTNAVATILFLPWIIRFLLSQIFPQSFGIGQLYQLWQLEVLWSGYSSFLSLVTNEVFVLGDSFSSQIVSAIIIVVLLFVFVFKANKTSESQKLLLWFSSLILFFYIFTPLNRIFSLPKYYLFIFPFFYLSLIGFLAGKLRGLLVLGSLIFLVFFVKNRDSYQFAEDWKGLSDYIENSDFNPKLIIMSADYLSPDLNYYLDPDINITCLKEFNKGNDNCTEISSLKDSHHEKINLVQTNWNEDNLASVSEYYDIVSQNQFTSLTLYELQLKNTK